MIMRECMRVNLHAFVVPRVFVYLCLRICTCSYYYDTHFLFIRLKFARILRLHFKNNLGIMRATNFIKT